MAVSETFEGLTAADVMLRQPKALTGSASVGEVRAMLANPSVQMVLLADGSVFRGAITQLPDDAPDDDVALDYAEREPESISPTDSAVTAFEVTARNPHRRVVVLGDGNELAGLLCLDATRTRFCGVPRASD